MGDKVLTWFVSLIALGVVVVLAGIVILGVMAATGSVGDPDECVPDQGGDPRGVSRTAELTQEWQNKWNAFDQQLDGGQSGSVQFTESEASSRSQTFLDSKDAPVKEVTICFHDGDAEARGTVDLPILADIPGIGSVFETDVRVRGTIDLSGAHPQIIISDLKAGNLPSAASDQLEGRLEDTINSRLDDLNIQHTHSVTFSEGSIEIAGSP